MSTRRPGLRERKKQRTREAIQDQALRLYQQQGYHQTTVEQIAEAADVSPSTFYRYYPTKPDTVLYDRTDAIVLDAILAQPADLSPLAATRAAVREGFAAVGPEHGPLEATRMRLLADVPELRAAAVEQLITSMPLFRELIARRTGRQPDDEDVQLWTGAVIGVMLAAFFQAVRAGAELPGAIDAAFDYLESGLPL